MVGDGPCLVSLTVAVRVWLEIRRRLMPAAAQRWPLCRVRSSTVAALGGCCACAGWSGDGVQAARTVVSP